MLREILEKVFTTKKFNQCKTSGNLKIDLFEILDNKNIGKLRSKYELRSNSDPSHILILLELPFLPPHLLPSQLKPLFNTILIMFFIGFPTLSYPIQPRAILIIRYTQPYGTPS